MQLEFFPSVSQQIFVLVKFCLEGTRRYSQRLAKPTTLKNDIKDVLQEISTAVESNKNTVSYINKVIILSLK